MEDHISYVGEDSSEYLIHYGILRKSGRYPWGSGKNPHQRSRDFLSYVDDLKKQGLSEVQIARAIGDISGEEVSTSTLRAAKAVAKYEHRAALTSQARIMKDRGMSNTAIGAKLGINESSVRALLEPSRKAKEDVLISIRDTIKDSVDKHGYIDVGLGVDRRLGVTETKFNTALAMLKEEGYVVTNNIRVPHTLNPNQSSNLKVISKPGTTWADVNKNRDNIRSIDKISEDKGETFKKILPPESISSKRVKIVYDEDGGSLEDGVMYLRRGAKGLDLGKASYAQVRIAVDDTHYLKGMALYKDDMPDGVDILFNTNKGRGTPKEKVFKELKDDPDNRFGAVVKRQKGYINIVNEEGDWSEWSQTIASQVLSKQKPHIAKEQLDKFYDRRKKEYDEINALTNPVIKKHLLESLSDQLDSDSSELKAAALPRQASHVILPLKNMKENEIYAPNYRNGEKVVLIRYPHGGIFEIPELTVNKNHPDGKKLIGNNARDAVGISPKTAEKLSGADFDGDTVLVIPNNSGKIKHAKTLEGLKDFDPKRSYPGYPGMKTLSEDSKQKQMGVVTNLVTDMTIKGASTDEIARAVRHTMVIIDATKHGLNYQQSYLDNGIKELHKKYQGSATGGSSTVISRAKSEHRVGERKLRRASEGGHIDPVTGEKIYTYSGRSYINSKGKETLITEKSTKMAEVKDAHTLSSGTRIEGIYADHANRLKALANNTRKEYLATPKLVYSPEAKKKYAKEVAELNAQLNRSLKNRPLERQANIISFATYKQKLLENPEMDDETKKKVRRVAHQNARARVGADRYQIDISDKQWEAIQAGAITDNKLADIIRNADPDRVRQLATPRSISKMTPARISRAKAMIANGYSRADVADALGISISTLSDNIDPKSND